jgi:hypothetical protein
LLASSLTARYLSERFEQILERYYNRNLTLVSKQLAGNLPPIKSALKRLFVVFRHEEFAEPVGCFTCQQRNASFTGIELETSRSLSDTKRVELQGRPSARKL